MPMALSAGPVIWQSYINAILSSVPDKSRYLAIMDDLLLHCSKPGYLKFLEDLLKALLKAVSKYHQRSVNSLELNYNIWVMLFYQGQKGILNN